MRLLAAIMGGTSVYLVAGLLVGRHTHSQVAHSARLSTSRVRLWLVQAGLSFTPSQFIFGSLAIGLLAFIVVQAVSGAWWLAAVPAFGAGLVPRAFFSRRRSQRLRQFRQAWPDCLRDIGAAISSGSTLVNALVAQAENGPEQLRPSFARFQLLSRMMGVVAALEVIKEELGDPVSDRVIEVLILAYQHGGELIGQVLGDLTDEVVEDLRLESEIRSDGTEQRMESWIVLIIPWALLLFASLTSDQYRSFYQSGSGLAVVALGSAWCMGGWLLIRRLSRPLAEPRILASPETVRGFL